MSRHYKTDDVNLSNKFSLIARPVRISQVNDGDDDTDEEVENYRWLAKSRRLQARRWRQIKYQQV